MIGREEMEVKKTLRVAIAQINSTVGDIKGNSQKILEYIRRARKYRSDIIVFPELALCGYPPEDLLLKPSFINENLRWIKLVSKPIKGITAIVGFADRSDGDIYNAAAVISEGKIKGVYHKMCLPNYSVFDEKRYFKQGTRPLLFKIGDIHFGVNICEDIWPTERSDKLNFNKAAGIIFVINASPYHTGKTKIRQEVIKAQAKENRSCICYANLVGAQDELVFDGQSFIVDDKGKVITRATAFKEDLLVTDVEVNTKKGTPKDAIVIRARLDLDSKGMSIPKRRLRMLDPINEVYSALVVGLRDYVYKNGFKKVVIGLSGGIDSAITVVIARDALQGKNVIGVFMPSVFTSGESKRCALALAKKLDVRIYDIPIKNLAQAYTKSLKDVFKGYPKNIAEENIQARIRGNILMAISNKFGYLVLATGNKSEISCGYCTLYGDMAGGFSVIKDVPKTLVYKLAKLINKDEEIIPKSILRRAPTAELRSNQKDTDTLPPYEVLDPIVKFYVEQDRSLQTILKKGIKRSLALSIIKMIDSNEYKRRQASPGVKITPKAFGKDRRMPITNRFVEK